MQVEWEKFTKPIYYDKVDHSGGKETIDVKTYDQCLDLVDSLSKDIKTDVKKVQEAVNVNPEKDPKRVAEQEYGWDPSYYQLL